MPTEQGLRVCVVYAAPAAQFRRELVVVPGTTVAAAIRQSGIAEAAGLRRGEPMQVGVFGRSVDPDCPLRDGDRVEIYRNLAIDPKAARRRRALGK